MARVSAAKSVAENFVVENIVEEETMDLDVTEKMNEEDIEEQENKTTKKKTISKESLNDYDEIEVISLIPNVSYKDSKTGDMYEWDEAGHVEYMTVETLKNMWRSHKGFFRNMWLKPLDERVINTFGLTKTFEKYEFLMDANNYTKKNIDEICKIISDSPQSLKFTICDKIKSLVVEGKISHIAVIQVLENRFKMGLI